MLNRQMYIQTDIACSIKIAEATKTESSKNNFLQEENTQIYPQISTTVVLLQIKIVAPIVAED